MAFTLGFNQCFYWYNYQNVWPSDRGGLTNLDIQMRNDKTESLGGVFITEQAIYSTQSLQIQKYRVFAGIVNEHGQIIMSNFEIPTG